MSDKNQDVSDKSSQLGLLEWLRGQENFLSMSAILELVGDNYSERTIRRWLTKWCEQKLLERSGKKKGTRYRYTGPKKQSLTFLQEFDADIQQNLLKQLRDLWTHASTALEGNTLTLGDTHFLLEEGLTISGKALKDHQEVLGHANAIELTYDMLDKPIDKQALFKLHLVVQTEVIHDIFKPNGAWKVEPNGTYVVTPQNERSFLEYSRPADVDFLMQLLLDEINSIETLTITTNNSAKVYAKIHMAIAHIHPFWDGNGRIARLIANIPLLKAGLPPLIISQANRREYIDILADYQLTIGQLTTQSGAWPQPAELNDFIAFCKEAYNETIDVLNEAKLVQKQRYS